MPPHSAREVETHPLQLGPNPQFRLGLGSGIPHHGHLMPEGAVIHVEPDGPRQHILNTGDHLLGLGGVEARLGVQARGICT